MQSAPNLSGLSAPQKPMTEEEAAQAYMKALTMLPGLIHDLAEEVKSLNDSLEVLAMYAKEKGIKEGVFKAADFE